MRTWNFGKCHRTAVFFRLCLVTIVALSLAMGGMALNPKPVRAAAFDIAPLNVAVAATECMYFQQDPGFTTSGDCCGAGTPANTVTYQLVGAPAWVNIDPNTGILSGCPDLGTVGVYIFGVGATGVWNGPIPPGCGAFSASTSTVTLTVGAGGGGTLNITPVFYPVAWEGIPFTMTLAATGCSGNYNWTTTPLPNGLAVTDPVLGIISGTPAFGTCGIYTITVTCTDTNMCPTANCCPPVSAPFTLIIDCWANYLPIFYYTTACDFDVEIGPGLTQGQTNVWVDGAHEATLVGGQSQAFTSVPCESHLVMVDQTVQVPNSNTRFSIIGSNTKTVTDIDNYAYFDYAQEVYIQTSSDPSGATQPPGTGFYTVGSNFISNAPGTVETNIQNGIKLVFREWGLPDGSTFSNHNLGFIVNQGGTAVAKYDTYYQLLLHSDYPPIDERSWERQGSTATWNLALHAVPMLGLWGFLGGVQSPLNASGSQLITGPSTVEIMWGPNYTMPIIAIIIVLLVIAGLVYLIYRLRSRSVAKPAAGTGVKKASSKAKKPVAENFCPKCGNPVDKDADYCKKCGKKLK